MAASKTARTLKASAAVSATSSDSATEWDLSTKYGGLLTIKLTNGGSAPTTVPTITVYVGEATTVKRKFWSASGDTTASSVNDYVIEIPPGAMFVNASITAGATNGTTWEVYGQELTGI